MIVDFVTLESRHIKVHSTRQNVYFCISPARNTETETVSLPSNIANIGNVGLVGPDCAALRYNWFTSLYYP